MCKDTSGIFIVTEYIPGGDLRSKLKDENLPMSWHLRVKIAIDVAYAMNYLHSKKMIHRDLKSQNLLVPLQPLFPLCFWFLFSFVGVAAACNSLVSALAHVLTCDREDPLFVLHRATHLAHYHFSS